MAFTEMWCFPIKTDNERIFAQHLQNKILPDHTYGVISGGDPLCIPDLTWEQLKQFHATHYHPSNSRYVRLVSDVLGYWVGALDFCEEKTRNIVFSSTWQAAKVTTCALQQLEQRGSREFFSRKSSEERIETRKERWLIFLICLFV